MTPYENYLPFLMLAVPECPEEIVIGAIGGAVIRLCEDAMVWKVNLPAIDIVQGTDTYAITPTDTGYEETRVVLPTYVEYDSRVIPPMTTEDLDTFDVNWRATNEGSPSWYVVEDIGFIRFNRKPDKAITDGLVCRVAIKPTQAAETAGDGIYEDYRETIECGALAILFGMPRKPWYDATNATDNARLFTYQIQRAKARVQMGQTTRPATFRMRKWV